VRRRGDGHLIYAGARALTASHLQSPPQRSLPFNKEPGRACGIAPDRHRKYGGSTLAAGENFVNCHKDNLLVFNLLLIF
jgi:hypothetical protein